MLCVPQCQAWKSQIRPKYKIPVFMDEMCWYIPRLLRNTHIHTHVSHTHIHTCLTHTHTHVSHTHKLPLCPTHRDKTTRTPRRVHAATSLLLAFSPTALFPSSFFFLLPSCSFTYNHLHLGKGYNNSYTQCGLTSSSSTHLIQSEFTHAPGTGSLIGW